MGPSAPNSSGVHWCWFNEVPEKVPEGSGRLWCGKSQVQQGLEEGSGEDSGRLWCRRGVRFNKVPEKVLEKVPEKVPGSGAGARSGSRRFREGSGSTRFHRRFWKALVESEARFNKVPEGVGEGFRRCWCKAGPGSTRFWKVWRRFRRRFRNALVQRWARFKVGSGAIRGVCWRNFEVNFQPISDEQFCENKLLLLLGIPPKLI